jgi:hypothetical protein
MKKQSGIQIILCMAALLLVSASVGPAQVLTFDDTDASPDNTWRISDGYGGFHWEWPFTLLNEELRTWLAEFGRECVGPVSGGHTAYIHNWGFAGPFSIWRDEPFTFKGAYLASGQTSWGYLTDNITIEGWANGALVYSRTVETNNQAPTWFDFNFQNIDKLIFSSENKVTCFVMDNFTFSVGTEVAIDIKPGSDPASINLKSKGVVPVAVLSTIDFNALDVDPGTVLFANAEPERWTTVDVDRDGKPDLLFFFRTEALNLTATSTEATLVGETSGGTFIQGTDSVRMVQNSGKVK